MEGEKTYRKKDRMREQEIEEEIEGEKEQGGGGGPCLPSHLGINPVARIKYSGQGFGPRSPQSKWKITGCVNRWQGNDSSVKSQGREKEGVKKGGY